MSYQKSDIHFDDVLGDELAEIADLRQSTTNHNKPLIQEGHDTTVYERALSSHLCGIAFSGGGIRSATFNLGVLQALSKKKRLHLFDYLSTVSGGGYIGSWLSALLRRNCRDETVNSTFVEKFQESLTTHPCSNTKSDCGEKSGFDDPYTSGFPPVEHAAVRFLRGYSNYLTPRLGVSGDTLALLSLFLRNLMLIQIVLFLIVATVLLIPYSFNAVAEYAVEHPEDIPFKATGLLALGVIALFVALFFCGRLLNEGRQTSNQLNSLANQSADRSDQAGREERRRSKDHAARRVLIEVIWPAFFGAWLLAIGISGYGDLASLMDSRWDWARIGALSYAVLWALSFAYTRVRRAPKKRSTDNESETELVVGTDDSFQPLLSKPGAKLVVWLLLSAAVAGAVFGELLYETVLLIDKLSHLDVGGVRHIVTITPPLLMLMVSFVITIHIGSSRDCFDEYDREWWARLGGFVLLAAAAWFLLFGLVLYVPPVVYWLGSGGAAIVFAWFASSGLGAWLAKNASGLAAGNSGVFRAALIKSAPWLFVAGLAALASFIVFASLAAFADAEVVWAYTERTIGEAFRWTTEQQGKIKLLHALAATALVAGTATVALLVFDINIFSAHSLYKHRLTRAYLGASLAGKRDADAFTGFGRDDLGMHEIQKQRPLHILNTTLNMTGGDDLAWQTRRASSFAITPKFTGYEAKTTQGDNLGCYRPTTVFADGITLGTAFAISGAAATPNMGYHTSPSVAALLTAFNLRLGYWAGNPTDKETWTLASPRFALKPVLAELTGSAKEDSPWINLSDGGHFENLGLYELVRRRCRLIIVTDAGCDPDHQFDDLANAIRKCWTDFGVHIQLDGLIGLRLFGAEEKYCQVQSTTGIVRYPETDESGTRIEGTIIYIKSSLTRQVRDNFPDIGQYADSHETFPHETTVDQFFDENQFEAYRHLGFVAAEDAIGRFSDEISEHLNIPTP